jgi:hypothetical protein
MRLPLLACSIAVCLALPAHAQTEFPARLAGHAVLPAQTFIAPPADAPTDLTVSGKFANGPVRIDAVLVVPRSQQGR